MGFLDGIKVNKFAEHDSLSATFEDVWGPGGNWIPLEIADVITISSDDLTDNGVIPNTGARTMCVQGIDANNNPAEEMLTLNGTTSVVGNISWLLPMRSFVVSVGSNAVNAGNITGTIGGVTQILIVADNGQTTLSQFQVPNGRELVIENFYASVGRGDDAIVELMSREWDSANNVYYSWRVRHQLKVFEAEISHDEAFGTIVISERGQVKVRAKTAQGQAACIAGYSGRLERLLIVALS